jgi:putative FmdB family regulatory protein
MPTYEYLCQSCNNTWEETQKISEPALDTCPKCHQKTARRQISGGNFILKGGGWYADLYSSSKPSGKKDDGGGSSSSGDSSSETKVAPAKDTTAASPAPAPASTSTSTSSGGSKD